MPDEEDEVGADVYPWPGAPTAPLDEAGEVGVDVYVISSISWRIFIIKLANDWLERGIEAIFEGSFSRSRWRDILSHLLWHCSEVMK